MCGTRKEYTDSIQYQSPNTILTLKTSLSLKISLLRVNNVFVPCNISEFRF